MATEREPEARIAELEARIAALTAGLERGGAGRDIYKRIIETTSQGY